MDNVVRQCLSIAEQALLARYRLHVVRHPSDPQFDVAYDALAAHFGPLGEIESRADVVRITSQTQVHDGIFVVLPHILAHSADGEVAAVAARYVTYEPATRTLAGLDVNVLCHPAHRGAGLGPLLEALLIWIGQQLLLEQGAAHFEVAMELGDLDPISLADPNSLRRAVVWGRSGYRVIPPQVFPLSLVGMQTESAHAPPLPMLPLLRFPLPDPSRYAEATSVRKAQLHTLARHLQAAHAYAADAGLQQATMQLHAAIARRSADPVTLLPLPQHTGGTGVDSLLLALRETVAP